LPHPGPLPIYPNNQNIPAIPELNILLETLLNQFTSNDLNGEYNTSDQSIMHSIRLGYPNETISGQYRRFDGVEQNLIKNGNGLMEGLPD
ncbi:hypothetical protein Mgra_00003421, partial [Meloidogyne graminicola]